MKSLAVRNRNVWRKSGAQKNPTTKSRLTILCVGAVLATLLPILGHAVVFETKPATIKWHTRACDGSGGLYDSVEAAGAQLAASCGGPCVDFGLDTTQIDADRYYAGANSYSPCLPRSTFEYLYDADTIVAIGSCAPGYTFQPGSVPGGSQTSGTCRINVLDKEALGVNVVVDKLEHDQMVETFCTTCPEECPRALRFGRRILH
jgi:hypothetical protein